MTGGISVKMLINISQSYEFEYTHIQTGSLPSGLISVLNQSLLLFADYLGLKQHWKHQDILLPEDLRCILERAVGVFDFKHL